jgi:hypothetical protein
MQCPLRLDVDVKLNGHAYVMWCLHGRTVRPCKHHIIRRRTNVSEDNSKNSDRIFMAEGS